MRKALMRTIITFCAVIALFAAAPRGNTGEAMDYRKLADEIFAEANALRADPKGLVPVLVDLAGRYRGNTLTVEGVNINSREGAAAVREAIGFCSGASPQPVLARVPELDAAARAHQADQAVSGALGHRGSDGSSPSQRIRRHLKSAGKTGECISYGSCCSVSNITGRDIVIQLLVDDGVRDRAHRKNLMNPLFRRTGIACGPHRKYEVSCVITYAD
jgi:uncharacterized protein YkwD